ncbi:MAG: hypothetical protein AB1724_16680 [Thermodesulfobacteriota bacterium]
MVALISQAVHGLGGLFDRLTADFDWGGKFRIGVAAMFLDIMAFIFFFSLLFCLLP